MKQSILEFSMPHRGKMWVVTGDRLNAAHAVPGKITNKKYRIRNNELKKYPISNNQYPFNKENHVVVKS
jgi:hypothetical protein